MIYRTLSIFEVQFCFWLKSFGNDSFRKCSTCWKLWQGFVTRSKNLPLCSELIQALWCPWKFQWNFLWRLNCLTISPNKSYWKQCFWAGENSVTLWYLILVRHSMPEEIQCSMLNLKAKLSWDYYWGFIFQKLWFVQSPD